MARKPSTILEKTMERGRSFVVAGIFLALNAGFLATDDSAAMFGWILGVLSVSAFLYGLITVHAATAEALVRARLVDIGADVGTGDPELPSIR